MAKLYVYVLEGRDFSVESSYVELQLGKFKSKTRVLRNTQNPVWNEEFAFEVRSVEDEELVVSVYGHDNDLAGRVRVPVLSVLAAGEKQSLPPVWYSLESGHGKGFRSIKKDCGKILLTLSIHGRGQEISSPHTLCAHHNVYTENSEEYDDTVAHDAFDDAQNRNAPHRIGEAKQLMKAVADRLERLFSKNEEASKSDDSSDLSATTSDYGDCIEEPFTKHSFEESIEMLESISHGKEMPEDLQGGILLDQTYLVPPKDLNKLLFGPDSHFRREMAELQGAKDVQEGPWIWKSEDMSCLTRVVSYTKAATKLVKVVKATEDQNYIKADGREFAVLVSVDTPDVPFGNTFKVELLYKIMPGHELPGVETSHLVISWGINFCQRTMMKGVIEAGARQGLKENFDQFAELLSQSYGTMNQSDMVDKDQILATLETQQQSNSELAVKYFCNFTVLSTVFILLYVSVHILLCKPKIRQGLEFGGLELPHTFGEFISSGIIFLQLERVYVMVSHFIQARLKRENNHGVKAQGEGWVLTVALIEATNLASVDSSRYPDPYVVFTCNGKTCTSSVKLQTLDPRWNEILEFDAVDEPPSVMDVEVFDFKGLFDEAVSLGHAEINFVRHNSTELADIWVSLEGILAQSAQSKLHLRIFLDNNNGVETIKDYLTKVEKEAGKKINVRSPHRNSTFQTLFGLPPEEFLIADFSCSLKRKLPLQGRLFLSARIFGFYANLFGHKTKFFFLWEDIEDIQILAPSLASMGSPTLVIVLRNGRGTDARHAAKVQDEEGRLWFYFHSFVSFTAARRTIMALWKTRTLSPDHRAQIIEKQQELDD